jgi:hypothetical protein
MLPALAIFAPLLPGILASFAQLYTAIARAPETPQALRAHYERLGEELEALCILVEEAPEPPEGSGA